MTLLAGMTHRRDTDPQVGQWLSELVESPLARDAHSDTGTVIRELKRDYDKKVKLPQSLVEEITRTSVLGQQAWVEARKRDDFKSFRPLLEKMVSLKRDEADALGFDECRYDALLGPLRASREDIGSCTRVIGLARTARAARRGDSRQRPASRPEHRRTELPDRGAA